MTFWQRFMRILGSLLVILVALVLMSGAGEAYPIIILVYGFSLFFSGISRLFFFFTMSKNMVGGKLDLYRGVFLIDIGVFTLSLHSIPHLYILLYLTGMLGFYGIVEILCALDSRRLQGHWMMQMARGIGSILIMFLCLFFLNSPDTAVIIYALGLIYTSILRIISAFRNTNIIAIQ